MKLKNEFGVYLSDLMHSTIFPKILSFSDSESIPTPT